MSYDPDDEVCLYWTQELRVVAKSFTSGVVAATLRDAWQDGGPPSSKPYRGFVEVTINRGGAYFPDDTLFALRVRNQDDRDSVYSFEPTQFPFRFGSAKQRVLRLNLHYGDRKQFCEVIEASGKAGFPNFVVSNRANIQLDDKGTSATLTLAAQAPYPSQSAREYAYRIQCGSSLIKPSFRFQEDKGFRKGKDAFYSTEFADLSAIVLQGQSFNRTSATDFEMHIQPNLEVRFTEGLRANFQILSLSSSNCAVMLTEQPASVEAWEVPNHKKPLISRVMRDGQYLYLKTDVVWKDGKGIAVIDEPQMYEVKGENRSLHWDLHNENHKCVGWDMTGGEIGTIKPGKHYWVGKFRDEVLYQSEPFEIGEEKITTITIPTLETTRAYELKAKAAKKKD